MRFAAALVLIASTPLLSCRSPESSDDEKNYVCTMVAVPGFEVSVTDALGVPIDGAVLTIRDGDYEETLRQHVIPGGFTEYYGAYERAGVYSLTISASGYADQTLTGLTVAGGICHVGTVELDIVLEP
jgi:hypothetical protein